MFFFFWQQLNTTLITLTFSKTPLYGCILGGASLLFTSAVESNICTSASSPEQTLGDGGSSQGESSENNVSVPLSIVAIVTYFLKQIASDKWCIYAKKKTKNEKN